MTISITVSHELPAITKLSENIITATTQIITVYQQSAVVLEAENFIYLYCQFLTFIVGQKITGDRVHLYQLIIEPIQQNTDRGKQLYKTIAQHTAKDAASVHDLVTQYGLVIVPVLKLAQFITDITPKVIQTSISSPQEEDNSFEIKIKESVLEIFNFTYQLTLEEINALQIANPLIFLLEHFSNTIGWLAGFFAAVRHQSIDIFLEKSLIFFNQAIQLESVDTQKSH